MVRNDRGAIKQNTKNEIILCENEIIWYIMIEAQSKKKTKSFGAKRSRRNRKKQKTRSHLVQNVRCAIENIKKKTKSNLKNHKNRTIDF